MRQSGQVRRTSRCASTASSESAKLNGSMPMSSRRVTVSGALLVCSVERTRWPVSDASIAICAVSLSRISPSMMTSGSARMNARSAFGEGPVDLGVDLHLAQARLGDLDRILGGPDLALRDVDVAERRVQRRRLARAGGADAQDHAVGALDRRLQRQPVRLGQAEHVDRDRPRRGEQAQDDVLEAVVGRDRRDAQLDLVLRRELGEVDLAVLRACLRSEMSRSHMILTRAIIALR